MQLISKKIQFLKPLSPIHLNLIFQKSSLKNQVRQTEFLTCKNQFFQLDFQKSSTGRNFRKMGRVPNSR